MLEHLYRELMENLKKGEIEKVIAILSLISDYGSQNNKIKLFSLLSLVEDKHLSRLKNFLNSDEFKRNCRNIILSKQDQTALDPRANEQPPVKMSQLHSAVVTPANNSNAGQSPSVREAIDLQKLPHDKIKKELYALCSHVCELNNIDEFIKAMITMSRKAAPHLILFPTIQLNKENISLSILHFLVGKLPDAVLWLCSSQFTSECPNLALPPINQKSSHGWTVLDFACNSMEIKLIQKLLELGATTSGENIFLALMADKTYKSIRTVIPTYITFHKDRLVDDIIIYLNHSKSIKEDLPVLVSTIMQHDSSLIWDLIYKTVEHHHFEVFDLIFGELFEHHFPTQKKIFLFGNPDYEVNFILNIQDMIDEAVDCYSDPQQQIDMLSRLVKVARGNPNNIETMRSFYYTLGQSRSHSIWQLFKVIIGDATSTPILDDAHISRNLNDLRYLIIDTPENQLNITVLPSACSNSGGNVMQITYPFALPPEFQGQRPAKVDLPFRYFNGNQPFITFSTPLPSELPKIHYVKISFSNQLLSVQKGLEQCSKYSANYIEIKTAAIVLVMRKISELKAALTQSNSSMNNSISEANVVSTQNTERECKGSSLSPRGGFFKQGISLQNMLNIALVEAASRGYFATLPCLVDSGADINYTDNGKSALLASLEKIRTNKNQDEELNTFYMLLQLNIDCTIPMIGYPAMESLVQSDDVPLVRLLYQKGAPVTLSQNKTSKGLNRGLLDIARSDTMKTFLRSIGATSVFRGTQADQLPIAKAELPAHFIAKKIDASPEEVQLQLTRLIPLAIERGSAEFLRLLVKLGADINAIDTFGTSPLIIAIDLATKPTCYNSRYLRQQRMLMIRTCLELGALTITPGFFSKSTVTIAASFGDLEIVRLLYEVGGASLDDTNNFSPLGAARNSENEELIEYMESQLKSSRTLHTL